LRWDDQSFKHYISQGVSLRRVVANFGSRTSTGWYGYHYLYVRNAFCRSVRNLLMNNFLKFFHSVICRYVIAKNLFKPAQNSMSTWEACFFRLFWSYRPFCWNIFKNRSQHGDVMTPLLRGAPRLGLALGPASAKAGPERDKWLLIAVRHPVVLYGVKRKTAANEAYFWDCCCNIGHFLCGVERVKRYVYNLLSVLYFVTNTIFVLIDYPLLQPLSVSVWLNVRFTPTVCLKTYTHTYEARTSEDLKYKKQAQSINQSLCSGPQPEV